MEEGQQATPAARSMPFDDSTPMPFGQYGPKPKGEGRKLGKTPPGYLLWLWDSGLRNEVNENTDRGRLARYIKSAHDDMQNDCNYRCKFDKNNRALS